jgi:hypothetical protein
MASSSALEGTFMPFSSDATLSSGFGPRNLFPGIAVCYTHACKHLQSLHTLPLISTLSTSVLQSWRGFVLVASTRDMEKASSKNLYYQGERYIEVIRATMVQYSAISSTTFKVPS